MNERIADRLDNAHVKPKTKRPTILVVVTSKLALYHRWMPSYKMLCT